MQRTALERSVAVFGVNRASRPRRHVADRGRDGAVSARSSTSQGARRILGDVRERVQEFELRGCSGASRRHLEVDLCNCAHECNCDNMIATRTPSVTCSTLARSNSCHTSPHAAQSMPSDRAAREPMPNAAQPSTQTAPLHQHPHPDPCSSDRCLICLTRPDDYEDVSRGMTCGMCSACGTFFCG